MNATDNNAAFRSSPYLGDLTDRYIFAVVKSLDPSQQGDVRDELQGSIEDAVAAKVDQGEDAQAAEKEVLTGLGDPGVLSAQFAERPLYLIGPKYFLTWWRLLKTLLIVVVPIVMMVTAVVGFISAQDVGEVIANVLVAAFTVSAHIAFWTTLVFFIMERTGTETGVEWSVDNLPEAESSNGSGISELVASWVFLAFMVAAVLWDHFRGFPTWTSSDQMVPVLNPALWPWQIAVLFAIIFAEFTFAFVLFRNRGWNRTLAIVNTMINISFAVWALTLLIGNELFNPEFLDMGFEFTDPSTDAMRVIGVIIGASVVVIAVWDIVDGWRKTINPRNRARC